MKRGTEHLLKFKKLKLRLGLSTWETKGLLQSIWDLAAENAILGDVGRFSNADIAFGVEYAKDPDDLIAALVECRWLDVDPTYRLMIHDWFDHCEDWVKKRVYREQGFETWSEFLESWGTSRATTSDKGRQIPPPTPPTAPAAENVGHVADIGGQSPPVAEVGSQNPPAAENGGERTPTAENGERRREVADAGVELPPKSAFHSLDHSHSHEPCLGHEPEPSLCRPPVAPLPGGDAHGPANGNGRRRRAQASEDARTFVAHVYAAWAGTESPGGKVLEKEALAAETLVECLRGIDPDGGPEAWGAAFAEHVRQSADREDKARHNAALALPRYSASFVAGVEREQEHQREQRRREAEWEVSERKREHREGHAEAYLGYVRTWIDDLPPDKRRKADDARQTLKQRLRSQLARWPTDDEELSVLAEWLQQKKSGLLSFWQWDEQMNPNGFDKQEAVPA